MTPPLLITASSLLFSASNCSGWCTNKKKQSIPEGWWQYLHIFIGTRSQSIFELGKFKSWCFGRLKSIYFKHLSNILNAPIPLHIVLEEMFLSRSLLQVARNLLEAHKRFDLLGKDSLIEERLRFQDHFYSLQDSWLIVVESYDSEVLWTQKIIEGICNAGII